MCAGSLLSVKPLSILLLLCCALTAEEALHLILSHPNEIDVTRTMNHHPGCTLLEPSGRVLRCPVRGYGEANFLCSAQGCWVKEPSNGLVITPSETKLMDEHFHAVEAAKRDRDR